MPKTSLAYAFADTAGEEVKEIITTVPPRWKRMPPLSRAVIVETGKILQRNDLVQKNKGEDTCTKRIGLVGASKWGSLATDSDFAESMREDVNLASPAIFGYTLANIPLAEAAAHFGLTGPVYAIIEQENPLQAATEEARLLLDADDRLSAMLACSFDVENSTNLNSKLSVTFTLVLKQQ